MHPFITITIVVLLMDAVWLTLNYKAHSALFASVQKSPLTVRVIPALLVYILIPAALVYFAVNTSKSLKESATKGALLGASMYGLYDLTNLSTLKGWTYEMAVKDTLWGTIVCASGAVAGYNFR